VADVRVFTAKATAQGQLREARVQLLLTYDFPPMGGGIARWMGELARRYPAGSLVVSTGEHAESKTVDAKYPNPVDRLPIPARRLRTVQGLLLWSRRVAALARTTGAEFVWCGNIKPAGYPARWTAARVGTPYGILVHGGDLLILRNQAERSRAKRRTSRALLGSASVVVANSSWTADLCRRLLDYLGVEGAAQRVRTVPLGTDPTLFRPGVDQSQVRNRYRLEGRRWLLTVARLTSHKGIDTALVALAQLAQDYPDLGYIVVGSGEEQSTLEAQALKLGISPRVRVLTAVPDDDLPALYNCAEIYLGLSRLMELRAEGFGISLVEAAACGLPVVAGRSGGIPETVLDGETGLLVAADDPAEASTAVRRLLDDGSLARRLGASGRKMVESKYNWDRVAADLARIGHELGQGSEAKVIPR
jgi:phosphatidyl-myo-inositol dimannoside synthase